MANWRKTLALRLTLVVSLGSIPLLLWAIGLSRAGEGPKTPTADRSSKVAGSPTVTAVDEASVRVREGAALANQPGYFKLTGDRLTFYAQDGRRFGGLENLGLERIAKIVSESPEDLDWCVTGTVTEYQGANYLLVSRAVIKSRSAGREVR